MSQISALLDTLLAPVVGAQGASMAVSPGMMRPPQRSVAALTAQPKPAAQASADPAYNDHSTRRTWEALLASIGGVPGAFGSYLLAKDNNANQQHFAQIAQQRRQQALSGSIGPDGRFDPDKYLKMQADLNLDAPSIEDIGRLQDMGGKRQDRADKAAAEHRALIGSVLAPFAGIPEDQRQAYRPHAVDVLVRAGIPEEEANYALSDLGDAHIQELLSAGIGGDKYLDNARGERSLSETERHNRESEKLGQGNLSVSQAHLGLARRADARAAANAGKAKGTPGLPAGFVLDGN